MNGAAKRLRRRIWAFFAKRALDAELEAELAAHLEMAIDDNLPRRSPPHRTRHHRRNPASH